MPWISSWDYSVVESQGVQKRGGCSARVVDGMAANSRDGCKSTSDEKPE